ncbi:uncharacterized protein [Watersipora subatra]|uniref:uncharacterized protein n=1 Tax=Watersipora subatra TaxID=2589382 RepID=UPI00355C4401
MHSSGGSISQVNTPLTALAKPAPLEFICKRDNIHSLPLLGFDSGSGMHRERLSRLRDQWIEREICQQPSDSLLSPSYSTADSGIEQASSTGDPVLSQRSGSSRVLCIDLDEDMLIASIQNEAETSQQMVNEVASTKSMRRRMQAYDDMTYRRRSVKAKQSLSTYTPVAPCHSTWGDIFDDMISELRGRRNLTSIDECEQCMKAGSRDSVYENDTASSLSRYGDERLSENIVDTLINSPWLVSSVSDYILCEKNEDPATKSLVKSATKQADKPRDAELDDDGKDLEVVQPVVEAETEGFWEENWTDRHALCEHEGKSTLSSCEGCEYVAQKTNSVVKPTICYMNQKCPSFDPSLPSGLAVPEQSNGTSSHINHQKDSLQGITLHRPDLASFTLPQSPIRKTESNSHVWIERDTKDSQNKLDRGSKPSIWKRIKRIFQ